MSLRQGTVRRYEPSDRSGEVLLDDGTPLALPAGALDPAVRLLRRGQRLRLRLDGGRVVAATLLGLPLAGPGWTGDAGRAARRGTLGG